MTDLRNKHTSISDTYLGKGFLIIFAVIFQFTAGFLLFRRIIYSDYIRWVLM